ncbi:MAG: nucleoside-diphosphate kinase [Deltaproteobacteria bacterium]|nr:nucleoside-diphosphate kinase [Deltaproteobacteria bacterium]
MAVERTLGIIKPDAVEGQRIGAVVSAIEGSGLRIAALKMVQLTRAQSEGFYYVHRDRPFFGSLVAFMSRGPIVVMVIEGDDAIARYRTLMGATDPAKASEGTLRKRFAKNIEENAVHGSDGPDTARFEIGYFFAGSELPQD